MFDSSEITPFYQRKKGLRISLPAPLPLKPSSIIGIVAGCRTSPSVREILFPASLNPGLRPLHGLHGLS